MWFVSYLAYSDCHPHLENGCSLSVGKSGKITLKAFSALLPSRYLLIEMLFLLPHLFKCHFHDYPLICIVIYYYIFNREQINYFRVAFGLKKPRVCIFTRNPENVGKWNQVSIHFPPLFLLPGNQISAGTFPLSTGWKIGEFGADLFVNFV